jgi:hypothetical protein
MPYALARRGRPRKNGERYPNGRLKHANGGANGEPPDAVATWARQVRLVRAEVLDKRWGSEIGRLHRFGLLSDGEMAACFRWTALQRRADMIRETPRRTPRAHEMGGTAIRSTGEGRRVTGTELDVLAAADEARKAIQRAASNLAYEALVAVALCDSRAAGDDCVWHVRAAARALLRHWQRK